MYRTVDFINSYSMRIAHERCVRLKDYPAHHLWGMNGISERGCEVAFHDGPDELQPLAWMGRLGINKYVRYQLWWFLTQRRRPNLFAAAWSVAWLLGLLRRVGLLRSRLVVLIHHPVDGHWLTRAALRGCDGLVFLNRHAMAAVGRVAPQTAARSHLLGWFVDAAFYRDFRARDGQPAAAPGRPLRIVAAGKELRDFDTLVEAVRELGTGSVHVEIYCSAETEPRTRAPNVTVVRGGSHGNPISYAELLSRYRQADLIAVPMHEADRTVGLTSVMDGFGVGRAMIVTRNPGIDYDLQALGAGFIVPPGDVGAWRECIVRLCESPARVGAMGDAAARFADTELTEADYAGRLDEIFARYFR